MNEERLIQHSLSLLLFLLNFIIIFFFVVVFFLQIHIKNRRTQQADYLHGKLFHSPRHIGHNLFVC